MASETLPVFTYERVFDAPRDAVFDAYANREKLAHWWGPKGFTCKVVEFDFSPQGIYLYRLAMPNGGEMWGKFTYLDIHAPERIEIISSFSDKDAGITRHPLAPEWPRQIHCLITFHDEGQKTRLKLSATPYDSTPAEIAVFANGMDSMKGGYGGMYDVLAEYLKQA